MSQCLVRNIEIAKFVGKAGQLQQESSSHGIAGGGGIVLQVPGSGDQGFMVVAGVVECTVRICKVLEHRFCQLLGRHKPARVKGGLVKFQQALDEVAVALQIAVELGLAGSFAGYFQDTLRTAFPCP